MRFRHFLVVLFCLSAPSLLNGQSAMQLAPEPIMYRLSPHAQIQSAATIGGTSLVVWGTMRRAGDTIVPSLMMGIMRDSTIRMIRQLHSNSAQPASYVGVFVVGARFVVAWNDLRSGAPGLYLQSLDTNGDEVGQEVRIGSGLLQGTVTTAGSGVSGLALFWSDLRQDSSGSYHVRLGPDGIPVGPARWLGPVAITAVYDYSMLGGACIAVQGTWRALFVTPDGALDSRSIDAKHLTRASSIAADTSVVELDDMVLQFYHSIFDSVPYRSIALPLDTAIRGSATVARDSNGIVLVRYEGMYLNHPYHEYYRWYELRIDSTVASPVVVDTLYIDRSACYYCLWSGTHVQSVQRDRGSDNRTTVTVTLYVSYVSGPVSSGPMKHSHSVDDAGRFVEGGIELTPPVRRAEPVERVSSDTVSRVRLVAGGPTLEAPVSPIEATTSQTRPSIVVDAGGRALVWHDNWSISPGFRLLAWHSVDSIPRRSPPPLSGPNYSYPGRMRDEYTTLSSNEFLFPTPGQPIVVVTTLTDEYKWHLANTPYYMHHYDVESRVYMGTSTGWKRTGAVDAQMTFYRPGFVVESISVDPRTRAAFIALEYQLSTDFHERWLLSIDTAGVLSRRTTTFYPAQRSIGLIALGPTDCLASAGRTIFLSTPTRSDSVFAFDSLHDGQRLVPGLGASFLRAFRNTRDPRYYCVERFDVRGRIDSRARFRVASMGDPEIIVHPIDGRVAVLWTVAESGIHLACLDSALNVRIADTLLYAPTSNVGYVTGAFDGDSLVVAWVEERSGDADIYGFAIDSPPEWTTVPASIRDVDHSNDQPFIEAIVPNPASHGASIQISVPIGESGVVEIRDLIGREVARIRFEPGTEPRRTITIDTDGMVSGSYFAVLRCGPSVDVRRLDVVSQ